MTEINKQEIEHAKVAATRTARALVIVAVIALSAIWLFNGATLGSLHSRRQAEEWYFQTREALCRFQAYKRGDSVFFQALAITTLRRKLDLPVLEVPCQSVESLGYVDEPWRSAACFGDDAALLLGKRTDPESTEAALSRTITTCFSDERSRLIMLGPRVLKSLEEVFEPSAWRAIVFWMMIDIWPPPAAYGYGGESSAAALYGAQLRETWTWLLERRLFALLYDTEGETVAVEALLQEQSENAFKIEQALAARDVPSITVPGLGTPLKADDFLVMMGPLIVLTYLIFYLSWRRLERTGGAPSEILRDEFPLFGSPRDPLAGRTTGEGLAGWSARALWFSILSVPTIVLVVLVVLRGNLVAILDSSPLEETWLEILVSVRGVDVFSLAIDVVNLAALWLTTACMFEVVSPKERVDRSRHLVSRLVVGAVAALFCMGWGWRAYSIRTVRYAVWHGRDGIVIDLTLILFLCFGLLWCWALAEALHRRSTISQVVAISGLVLSFLLLK